jgi:glycosyltransferase involved in cell wall biosynthesis
MKTVGIWRINPYIGGTEVSLIELARFLSLSGYEVWVYGSDKGIGPIARELGISISPEEDVWKHKHDILLWYDDFRVFRQQYGCNLDTYLTQIPHRFAVFGGFAFSVISPLFKKAIAKSREIAAWLFGHGIETAKVSQFPIDLDYWKAESRKKSEVPIVGYVGRVENKNIKQLLSIANDVSGCKVRLVINTRIDPDNIASMKYEIFQNQLLMKPYYQGMDIFMMTSLTEGVPRVLMEAMAMSLPIVTWGIGGIPNLNPKFMLAANSVSEARTILKELVANPDLRQEVSIENRRRIEDYDRRIQEDLLAWFGGMI